MHLRTLDPLNSGIDLYMLVSSPEFNQSGFTERIGNAFWKKMFDNYLELYRADSSRRFDTDKDLDFCILNKILENKEFSDYKENFQIFLNGDDASFIPVEKYKMQKDEKEVFQDYKRYLKNGLALVREEDFLSILRNTRPLPISKLDLYGSEMKEVSALMKVNPDVVFTASIFLLRNNLINKNTTNYGKYDLYYYIHDCDFRLNFAIALEIVYMFYFINDSERQSFDKILKKEKINIKLNNVQAYKEFLANHILKLSSFEIFNSLDQIFSDSGDKKLFLDLYDDNIKCLSQNIKGSLNLDDPNIAFRIELFIRFLKLMKHIEENREEIIYIMTPYLVDR